MTEDISTTMWRATVGNGLHGIIRRKNVVLAARRTNARHMWRPLLVCAMAALLAACGDKQEEDFAAIAAKSFYESLANGRYAEYVNGFSDADDQPSSYKEQLIVNAKQFAAQQKTEHGGIVDVRTVSSRIDSLQGRTDVFLLLCFGDSTKEEVVVPMVERNGVWKMK